MINPLILAIDQFRPEEKAMSMATQVLETGGILVAPTETRYGLMTRIDNIDTVERLFALKKREKYLPTAIFVRSHDEIEDFGFGNPISRKLAKRFLPGPMTLILRTKKLYPPPIVVDGKIGIRYSSAAIVKGLLKRVSSNLTATSANLSGKESPKTISEIASLFKTEVALYLDAGPLAAAPSTVVDCSADGFVIRRHGAISEEEIKENLDG
ncbi:MAG: L-threonylcarbamoyladenylate synthase [candidate division Zixibacteria bacterium]|nr:L-threonylcarbamoyladenylate synthase [candidate division Zixibacteria bacterium]